MAPRKHRKQDISPEVARLRARVGALAIAGASAEERQTARAELAEAAAADHLRRFVTALPPGRRERFAETLLAMPELRDYLVDFAGRVLLADAPGSAS